MFDLLVWLRGRTNAPKPDDYFSHVGKRIIFLCVTYLLIGVGLLAFGVPRWLLGQGWWSWAATAVLAAVVLVALRALVEWLSSRPSPIRRRRGPPPSFDLDP